MSLSPGVGFIRFHTPAGVHRQLMFDWGSSTGGTYAEHASDTAEPHVGYDEIDGYEPHMSEFMTADNCWQHEFQSEERIEREMRCDARGVGQACGAARSVCAGFHTHL